MESHSLNMESHSLNMESHSLNMGSYVYLEDALESDVVAMVTIRSSTRVFL
jgi:hypothetical protein